MPQLEGSTEHMRAGLNVIPRTNHENASMQALWTRALIVESIQAERRV